MMTTVKVSTASMKAQGTHPKRVRITRKKWGLDEELLLLRLFKIYNRSWSQYVAYYPGRNVTSIRNKYYTLARRGDAYNRAIYGNVALDNEITDPPLEPQSSKSSASYKRAPGSNILDLSIISHKNVSPREDMLNNTPNCLTPDATDAFLGSDYNTNGGTPGTLPGTDYHDALSLERFSSSSDDGVATPSLLTEPDFLVDNYSNDGNIQSHSTTNVSVRHIHPAVQPDKLVLPDYHPPGLLQAGHQSPLNLMFTIPFQAIPYRSPHPLITHTFPVLSPIYHSPVHGFQYQHPFKISPPFCLPFNA
ncbi:Hypothetical protein GLP15_1270 [Giardia lamblia P15]|uniref:Uncharacterized protein n=1 Tax=Giardia intestinalis (strain P15) TaxID=658858 RepID=E1EZP3_GIAIA|nr:Hypothetical protein GLP15_1270 [Giardia lamblia P15]